MRICHLLLHGALLGSTLAAAAMAPAAGATLTRDDWKRNLAVTGNHPSTWHRSAASGAAHVSATYTVLHNFAGAPDDGAGSGAEVTLDSAGNIYGTTDYGGANTYGVIFKLAPDGTENLLHSFGGAGDGQTPDGAVTIEANGDMYGTTTFGGGSGNGNIWELATDGTYTVLHNFTTDEGNFARGRLIQDRRGDFYGTALFGGVNGDGTVFKYSARGKLTVLHAFNGSDGEFPEHGVVRDKAGNLYGVTAFGGASENGTVYRIAKNGTFSTLYSFTGGADGGFLYGGLAIDRNGNLYGSTDDGGADSAGTVFKMTSDGALTTLYNFTGGADGEYPEGDMLRVGKNLYSTTTGGGADSDGGIYELTSRGKLKVLQNFSATNGNYYSAGLTLSDGTFYGTTEYGGTDDNGVVFSLTK
ncbi:MAG: choice-of-anchor tandem repeat GloVer-containing protein [Rhizomicrobium sp.]